MRFCGLQWRHMFVSVICLCLVGAVTSFPTDDNVTSRKSVSVVVAVSMVVTAIIFVIGCACCLRPGFQKFTDNTGSNRDEGPDLSFSSGADGPIDFEPLPDIRPRSYGDSVWSQKRPPGQASGTASSVTVSDWFENPHVNFSRSQLQYLRQLGSGWFGQVIEGEAHGIVQGQKKTRVAVKALREDASPIDHMYFLHEVKMYRDANHPNVLRLLGRCLETDPFLVILEYCHLKDLKSFLLSRQETADVLFQQAIPLKMACDISNGLAYLHQMNFMHTDLAARNCLVTADLSVKIGDYGFAIETFKDDYYTCGNAVVPVRWLAPESLEVRGSTLELKEVTAQSNVWSFGVVLWEIMEMGALPYSQLSNQSVIQKVIVEQSVQLPPFSSYQVCKVMRSCCVQIEERPSMAEVSAALSQLYHQKDQETGELEARWTSTPPNYLGHNHNLVETTPAALQSFESDFIVARSASLQNLRGSLEDLHTNMFANASLAPEGDRSLAPEICDAIQMLDDVIEQGSGLPEFRVGTEISNTFSLGPLDSMHSFKISGVNSYLDTDESDQEETWKQKVERGAVAEMVREKSRSVHDFMQLTHVDVELSDSDSSGGPKSSLLFVSEGNLPAAVQRARLHTRSRCSSSDGTHFRISNGDGGKVYEGKVPSGLFVVDSVASNGVANVDGTSNTPNSMLGLTTSMDDPTLSHSRFHVTEATPDSSTPEPAQESSVILGPMEEFTMDYFKGLNTTVPAEMFASNEQVNEYDDGLLTHPRPGTASSSGDLSSTFEHSTSDEIANLWRNASREDLDTVCTPDPLERPCIRFLESVSPTATPNEEIVEGIIVAPPQQFQNYSGLVNDAEAPTQVQMKTNLEQFDSKNYKAPASITFPTEAVTHETISPLSKSVDDDAMEWHSDEDLALLRAELQSKLPSFNLPADPMDFSDTNYDGPAHLPTITEQPESSSSSECDYRSLPATTQNLDPFSQDLDLKRTPATLSRASLSEENLSSQGLTRSFTSPAVLMRNSVIEDGLMLTPDLLGDYYDSETEESSRSLPSFSGSLSRICTSEENISCFSTHTFDSEPFSPVFKNLEGKQLSMPRYPNELLRKSLSLDNLHLISKHSPMGRTHMASPHNVNLESLSALSKVVHVSTDKEESDVSSGNSRENLFLPVKQSDSSSEENTVLLEDLENTKKRAYKDAVQSDEEYDDILYVDTETNQVILFEGEKPKSHLAFINEKRRDSLSSVKSMESYRSLGEVRSGDYCKNCGEGSNDNSPVRYCKRCISRLSCDAESAGIDEVYMSNTPRDLAHVLSPGQVEDRRDAFHTTHYATTVDNSPHTVHNSTTHEDVVQDFHTSPPLPTFRLMQRDEEEPSYTTPRTGSDVFGPLIDIPSFEESAGDRSQSFHTLYSADDLLSLDSVAPFETSEPIYKTYSAPVGDLLDFGDTPLDPNSNVKSDTMLAGCNFLYRNDLELGNKIGLDEKMGTDSSIESSSVDGDNNRLYTPDWESDASSDFVYVEGTEFNASKDEGSSDSDDPNFEPSVWNKHLTPYRSSLKTPEKLSDGTKNVNFKRGRPRVYEYPPTGSSDSELESPVTSRRQWSYPAATPIEDSDCLEDQDDGDSCIITPSRLPLYTFPWQRAAEEEEGEFFLDSSAVVGSEFFPGAGFDWIDPLEVQERDGIEEEAKISVQ